MQIAKISARWLFLHLLGAAAEDESCPVAHTRAACRQPRAAYSVLQTKQTRVVTGDPEQTNRSIIAFEDHLQPLIGKACQIQSPWLTNMPRRHDLKFPNYQDSGGGAITRFRLQGLFVYPPKKFAICLIEKNACSTWITQVLQPLLTGNATACIKGDSEKACYAKLGFINWNIAKTSRQHFGQNGIESIFQDPTATRAVFLRDPLERFASAYFNKCIGPDRWNCIVPFSSTGTMRKFRNAVEYALTQNMSMVNAHWQLQAEHCELRTRIKGYNIIGLMKRETFEQDMNCVLSKAGLDRFVSPEHAQINPTTFGEQNRLSPTMVLQKLFPPVVARALINHLSVDYDLFGFAKEPEWISQATGEWYDKDPTPNPSLHEMSSEDKFEGTKQYTETDDLVELAIRTGFASEQERE